jgi:hypothetical protein
MLNLAWYNLPLLGVALLIGIATARWAFSRPAAPAPDREAEDDPQP